MSHSLNPFPMIAKICFALALLLAPAAVMTGGGTLSAAVADDVQSAVDTITAKTDPGDSKMEPIMTETNKVGTWVIWVFWVTVPLILFGGLIAWGVIQAKQNGVQAAQNTFIAIGLGVIAYFGVLAIFF